jgi:sugar/nucleoside kinase (ribokinase family)
MSVLVVGSVALDDIEAPAGSAKSVLGGAASYFGVAASYFTPVRVVAVVGDDFPQEHVDFLASRGLDLAGLQRVPGRTFRWGGRYHESLNQRDTLFTELGVFESFRPEIPAAWRDSEWVFLANIQPELQRGVLEQIRAPRFSAMDTMNFWIEGARPELEKTLAKVGGLVINDEEARLLTRESNLVRAADAIHALGPRVVIVKRGEHRRCCSSATASSPRPPSAARRGRSDRRGRQPSAASWARWPRRASSTPPARRAVMYGSVLASFCREDEPDRFRTLERADIDARFEAFRKLTRF